jgi:predicted nucleotidyltransferase
MPAAPAMIQSKIIDFYELIKTVFPVRKVLLYGSYAKGTQRQDSDIDVAVVVDLSDHSQRISITTKLFGFARQIDARIEPKTVFWDEYLHHENASILAEIIRTSIELK